MVTQLGQASTQDESAAVERPLLSSLSAFLRAGFRPRTALARAIVAVLAIKLVAVLAMAVYFNVFNQHVVADAAAIDRLIGPASPP